MEDFRYQHGRASLTWETGNLDGVKNADSLMEVSAGPSILCGVPSSANLGSVVALNSAFTQDSLLSSATPLKTSKRRSPSASKQAATDRMRIRILMRRRPGSRRPLGPIWTPEPRPTKEIQTGPRPRRWPSLIQGAMEVKERPMTPTASSAARQMNAFRMAVKGKFF